MCKTEARKKEKTHMNTYSDRILVVTCELFFKIFDDRRTKEIDDFRFVFVESFIIAIKSKDGKLTTTTTILKKRKRKFFPYTHTV